MVQVETKRGRKGLGVAAALVAGGMLLAGPAQAEPEHSWKMATSWGGGPIMELGPKCFAERIGNLTDGRIDVEVFPGGALGKALKVTDIVRSGAAEAGHTWMGYDWGRDRAVVVFAGFAGSMDSERALHWLYQGGGAEMQKDYRDEVFGVVSIPLGARTAEAFLHSRKPVRTMEDLDGLKLRTAGAWLEIVQGLGASPVTMPGSEVYTSLERGVIDATEWGTLYENQSSGFHKIAEYVMIPGVHQPMAMFELVVNPDAYAKLSDKDKALVDLAARSCTMDMWMKIGHEDAKALQFYKSEGNQIVEIEPEAQIAMRQAALEWAKAQYEDSAWFKKAYESQLEYEDAWKDASSYRNVQSAN
ncbi:MAG: TRAP transporter substrate-binding protein [Rhodospirillales bacterium]